MDTQGAIGTQVGAIRFANMTLADNGGGPFIHVTNGEREDEQLNHHDSLPFF
jgi:hypothetical protein